jgi:hypothetical protein
MNLWLLISLNFAAVIDKAGIPNVEIQAIHIDELARQARDPGTKMFRIYTGYDGLDF